MVFFQAYGLSEAAVQILAATIGITMLAVAAVFAIARAPALRLGRLGLKSGEEFVDYRDIRFVRPVNNALEIVTYDGRTVPCARGPEPGVARDVAHVGFHILRNAERAQRPLPARADPPRVLHDTRSSSRAWLDSVDAAAARVGEGAGYRTEAIAPTELEAILSDGDRPAAVRALAARLLVRAGATKTRIEEALLKLHGRNATKRARIVAGLDDASADAAAKALDALREDEAAELESAAEDSDVEAANQNRRR